MDYNNNQTYYDILGVTKDASLESIMKARDRLKYGSSNDRVPFSMWDKIDKAYDILSDSEKRREYDKNVGVNEFGGTFLINPNVDFNSNVLDNNSTEDLDEIKGQDQPKVETTLPEMQPEQVKENTDMVPLLNHQGLNNQEPESHQPTEETSNELSSNIEPPQPGEDKKGHTSNDGLKNDIFEELKFKPVEKSQFKDADSIMAGKTTKKIGKFVAAGALAFTVLGPYGVSLLAVGYLINKKVRKKVKKAKLTKESYIGIITEVQTTESRLIEESNQRLMANIDKLLDGNYNDVELQKQKLNYANQVELLEKMVEIRKNTKKEKGQLTRRELRIQALKGQLHKAKKDLRYIEKNEKRNELVDSIGIENINLDSRLMKNLTIGNKILQIQEAHQKIKLQGGPLKSAKNFLSNKLTVSDGLKQDIIEEQQRRYR